MIPLIVLLGLLGNPGDGPTMPPVPTKTPPVGVAPPTDPSRAVPSTGPDGGGPGGKGDPSAGVEILFLYGTEKKDWIEAATRRFHVSGPKLPDGRPILVTGRAAGSGEIVEELLKGAERGRAHLISPAASAFLTIGNAQSNEAERGDLVGPPLDLVRSPVVVAIWREQAEALGWPGTPISWSDLALYARDPAAWAKVAGAGAAPFKIAHTHPERSSSGLQTLFALAYAHSGKFAEGLVRTDVAGNAEFAKFFAEFERAVPFYESSTGILATRMLEGTPADLTAAVVYENLVMAANRASAAAGKPPRVVAIYPSEGTFPTGHPAAVVRRPWVTDAHRLAAEMYVEFLRSPAEQDEARKLGFRGVDRPTAGEASLTAALGVSPAEPKELQAPPASVIQALRTTWDVAKNPAAGPARGK